MDEEKTETSGMIPDEPQADTDASQMIPDDIIPDDDIPVKDKKKQKKSHRALKIIALLLVCAIISSVCGAASAGFMFFKLSGNLTAVTEEYTTEDFVYVEDEPVTDEETVTEEEVTEETTEETTAEETTAAPTTAAATTVPATTVPTKSSIYSNAVHSVVGVLATHDYTVRTILGSVTKTSSSSGTGFYVASGYVVTNAHVIEDGQYIKVTDYDGNTYNATVVATMNNNDVAILKTGVASSKLTLGSSGAMNVGDDCMIIGNPMGSLSYSYTNGMISYCNRTISTDSGYTINMFQTDAAINSGNSGGPVFNNLGQVIGIATAKYSTSEGLSFFIPIDDVKSFIYSHTG